MGLLVSDHSLRVSTARRPTRAMVKHNNLLPNGHFKKFWQLRVRTWFDQAGQKKRRRLARKEKAQAVFTTHRAIKPEERATGKTGLPKNGAYVTAARARADARLVGVRAKKAAAEEEKEKQAS